MEIFGETRILFNDLKRTLEVEASWFRRQYIESSQTSTSLYYNTSKLQKRLGARHSLKLRASTISHKRFSIEI